MSSSETRKGQTAQEKAEYWLGRALCFLVQGCSKTSSTSVLRSTDELPTGNPKGILMAF